MNLHKQNYRKGVLCMSTIAQEAHHRQRMMIYSTRHGLEETAIRYKTSRKTVWKWKQRWDGTWQSLQDRSRRPHNSPKRQSPEELKLVKGFANRYRKDLILAYQKATTLKSYSRSYGCFKHTASKLLAKPKKAKNKRKNKPYQRADYPGQKVQIDVKFVPSYCVVGGGKYYQFTAKDECSRWTFREMYNEHSTASAYDFLKKLIKSAPFPIRLVQTDNGTEFTNALLVIKATHKTLFEQALLEFGIEYKRIRIATPRHNGKVERQHRTDEMRFYKKMRMFSLEDGRKQLAVYQRNSNSYIMTCLGMKSPNEVVELYRHIM